jgi:uncharacterized protein YbjT (DUF2867 family)
MRILVVGATGQLGTVIVRQLAARGASVRALIRDGSNYTHLSTAGDIEFVLGDLTDLASLRAACKDTDAVIATANVVFPRTRYSFAEDEVRGYQNLVAAARDAQVNRLVFISVPKKEPWEAGIPTFTSKRAIEREIAASGVPYTIFRSALFMDEYFALIGSKIPLRNADASSLTRSFWLTRMYMALSGSSIDRGFAFVPGSPDSRHAFIAIQDVAALMINCLDHSFTENAAFDIGGPENLSWREVAGVYERATGRRVRAVQSPPALARLGFHLLKPFSEAASNALGLMWILSRSDTILDTSELAEQLGVSLTSAEQFIAEKMSATPAGAPATALH